MRTYRARRFNPESDPATWRAESLPEMLIDSVCFDIRGCGNTLDGCFADTGETGFRIDGATFLTGCHVFNNYRFGMDHIPGRFPSITAHLPLPYPLGAAFFSRKKTGVPQSLAARPKRG